MHMLVTGAAGFIGSNLVDRLLELGYQVTGVDNLSTGQIEFLGTAIRNNKFQFITYDLFKQQGLEIYMKDVDTIFHLAANADVRFGSNHPRKDLEQNTIVTHNVLEAMRISGVRKIVFPQLVQYMAIQILYPHQKMLHFLYRHLSTVLLKLLVKV